MRQGRLGLALFAFSTVAACSYDPQPKQGVQQCSTGDNRCPDGYVCSPVDNHCYTPDHLPDASLGTGGVAGTGGSLGKGGATTGTGGADSSVGSGVDANQGKGGALDAGQGDGGAGLDAGLDGGGRGAVDLGRLDGASAGIDLLGAGGSTVIDANLGTGGVSGTDGAMGVDASGVVAVDSGISPNSGNVVTISGNQARGAMTGYGWIALGALDTVTDPTCRSPLGPITSSVTCNFTVWSRSDAYCATGSIPAAPAGSTSDYFTQNWGIGIGINATADNNGVLGQSFGSITVHATGSPTSGLRMTVHRKGDTANRTYCSPITPDVAVPLASFNTSCWDGSGEDLTAADVPSLDSLTLQVPSLVGVSVTVSNLCLTGITFTP